MGNIRISVRNLIEFIYRQGDIDDRVGSLSVAQEGTRLHKMIQKEIKEKYDKNTTESFYSEVFLTTSTMCENVSITLEGRADGLIISCNEDGIEIAARIIEIKSTVKDSLMEEEEENFLHWAQAKLYGYIYCTEKDIDEIDLDLIYCHRESLKSKTFTKHFKRNELEEFFQTVITRYITWIELQSHWLKMRNPSIEELVFPFPSYRKGQRNLAVNVYRTIKEGKVMYIEAPTGTGKTISTLFPAIKSLSLYPESKIIYLTAKNITKGVVEETIEVLKKNNLHLRTLTITAKDKICFLDERSCNAEDCIYAKGHFDRVNDAIIDILNNHEDLTENIISQYSEKHRVCPFELSLDLIEWSDLILCDYNYFFDPKAMIKRLEFDTMKYIFLVDEAHNLVERSRSMYSAEMSSNILKKAKTSIGKKDKKLIKHINKLLKYIKEYMNEDKKEVIIGEGPESFLMSLRLFVLECERYLKENVGHEIEEDFLELYFNCLDLIRIGEFYSDDFVFYAKKENEEEVIKIFCLNPSSMIEKCIKDNISTIFFSATLSPMGYYKKLLGNGQNEYSMRLDSPFPPENRKLIVKEDIDTRYKYRKYSYDKVVSYIHKYTKENKGNFLVFFPSFDYMDKIYEMYCDLYSEQNIMIQQRDMMEREKIDYLARFEMEGIKTIGFAVLGGAFSEGIDLWGNKLKGAIIVGVGLPKVSFENNLIEKYFTEIGENGFYYSYTFPGINKVIQAMGRVIRREDDKGIIILMDKRYGDNLYRKLIP